jgi:uroporphyrinogen III methyltransferase/synthase
MPTAGTASPRPLEGVRVVVTRASGQEASLADALAAEGAAVLHRPLIRLQAATDPQPLLAAARRAAEYDWLVFTSANAVGKFSEALHAAGVPPSQIEGVRIAAVGPATSAALEASGFHVDLLPGEALAESIAHAMAAATDLNGSRVLWPRARGARADLASSLVKLGATVDAVEAYRTVLDVAAGADLRREVADGSVDVLTFTSPSTVTAFAAGGTASAGRAMVATIGPVTAAAARARGLPVHVQADPHTATGLVAALRAHLERARGN